VVDLRITRLSVISTGLAISMSSIDERLAGNPVQIAIGSISDPAPTG
jgi:hypothetical protein